MNYRTMTIIGFIVVATAMVSIGVPNDPTHPMRGWRLCVDATDAQALEPTKNPALKAAIEKVDRELPLKCGFRDPVDSKFHPLNF